MPRQGPAPLQKPFMTSDINQPGKGWGNWFADLGDNLQGEWGLSQRMLDSQNIDTEPTQSWVSYQGREVRYLFIWDAGFTASANAKFMLGATDYTLLPGMLEIWETDSLTAGAYSVERDINIPAATYSGRVIIQGSLLTKKRDPRG